MGTVKQIDIKNRTYYFYNDMIDIKTFDSDLLKIDIKALVFTTLDILQLKKLMIMKIFMCKSFIFNYYSCKWVYWGKRCK